MIGRPCCEYSSFTDVGISVKRAHIISSLTLEQSGLVVIPEYDEIDPEITKNNMKTVGMTREDYFELLKRV